MLADALTEVWASRQIDHLLSREMRVIVLGIGRYGWF